MHIFIKYFHAWCLGGHTVLYVYQPTLTSQKHETRTSVQLRQLHVVSSITVFIAHCALIMILIGSVKTVFSQLKIENTSLFCSHFQPSLSHGHTHGEQVVYYVTDVVKKRKKRDNIFIL